MEIKNGGGKLRLAEVVTAKIFKGVKGNKSLSGYFHSSSTPAIARMRGSTGIGLEEQLDAKLLDVIELMNLFYK